MKITNKYWNPQNLVCGYVFMSANHGALVASCDISHMLLS